MRALGERRALLDAEAVLLVDDRDGEVAKLEALLDQRVRADDDVRERRVAATSSSPVTSAQETPSCAQMPSIVRKCCSASVSVGAISAP